MFHFNSLDLKYGPHMQLTKWYKYIEIKARHVKNRDTRVAVTNALPENRE